MIFFLGFMACSWTSERATSWTSTKNDSIVTKQGNYYMLVSVSPKKYRVKWGNEKKSFVSEKIFEQISREPTLSESSKDAIVLTESCGSFCSHTIILSLSGNVKDFSFVKAISLDKNLVAIGDPNGEKLLLIENFVNGKTKTIEIETCPAANKAECIDFCKFSGNLLILKYQGNKWATNSPDPKELSVDIADLQ